MQPEWIVALVLGIAAAKLDVSSRQIPNWLTYPSFGIGIALSVWPEFGIGLVNSLVGALVAFLPPFLLFSCGRLGGGDVKLLAAVGSLVGFPSAASVLFASVIISFAYALVILVIRILPLPAHQRREALLSRTYPFGVAVLVGVMAVWLRDALLVDYV